MNILQLVSYIVLTMLKGEIVLVYRAERFRKYPDCFKPNVEKQRSLIKVSS